MSVNSVHALAEVDLYVWEGSSDLLVHVERCLAGTDARVITVDAAGEFHRYHDRTRSTLALVSVSVMADGRFAGSDWLAANAVPVIWVASEERGYDPRFYPPAYSHTLPLSFSCSELRVLVQKLVGEVSDLRRAESGSRQQRPMVAVSAVMREVIADTCMYAACDASVLVHGETGVGKERIARLLHEQSSRADGPFVAVNCGAIPEGLFEGQFFGHARGAFTGAVNAHKGFFEQADGGTLFLDEIGELPLDQQVKLLRVLEDKAITRLGSTVRVPVDFRIVVATHRNLRDLVGQGQFRADLYYRLVVIELFIPNLEQRGAEEKKALFKAMLEQELGPDAAGVPPWLLERVGATRFPGNVRELANLAERCAIVRSRLATWDDRHLDRVFEQFHSGGSIGIRTLAEEAPVDDDVRERQDIIAALDQHGWRRQDTADFLGISRKALWERMRRHNITAEQDLHRTIDDE